MPPGKPARMSERPNSLPREAPGLAMPISRTGQYRGYQGKIRGSSSRGRLWLVLIFCALRGADALIYFGAPAGDKSRLLTVLLAGVIWGTAFLGGVWGRRQWCKYGLILLIVGCAGVCIMLRAGGLRADLHSGMFLGALVIEGGVVWALGWQRDIKRLTGRAYL
jgi:hypothetical protein